MVAAEAKLTTARGDEYLWPKMPCHGDGGCLKNFEYYGDPRETFTRPA